MASVISRRRALRAVALLSGLGLLATLLLLQLRARDSWLNLWAAPRIKYLRPLPDFAETAVVQVTRVFNLSSPGITTVCNHTLPPPYDGSEKLVNVTHVVCCDGPGSNGSDGQRHVCRTAKKQLQIPAENERAMRTSGERAIDLHTLNFVRSFVFVTGTSSNHFNESLVQLGSIQKFFPCTRVLYWDLGLQPVEVQILQSFCGVEYRRFNFSKYPPHVAALTTYAFKPLALMESFMEHPVLWWVDSSIRFTNDLWRNVVPLVKQRHGIIMFREPHHSVYSTTYPQTFEYLGTDVELLKRVVTVTGANFLVTNTPELFSTVLYWFYACALDVRCIAPIMYAERCKVKGLSNFGYCHRFDQSVLTMIVANVWGFNSELYRYQQNFFSISRRNSGSSRVKQCSLVDFESSLKTEVCRAF